MTAAGTIGYSGVAISGKAGSGKTSLAGGLCDVLKALGRPAMRVAFADEIKREVYEMYGLTKGMPGGREKLIEHGEMRRNEQADYWIRRLAETTATLRQNGYVSVIDDLRFPAEFKWCRAMAYFSVRLEVPTAVLELRTYHADRDTYGEVALDSETRFDLTLRYPALYHSSVLSAADQFLSRAA